jgi:putative ABC transport system permease protein
MLKNYLITALRIMSRQKAYAAINIFGLSLGIAASLLIIIYVVDELSYDRFHTDADNIYRVDMTGKMMGNEFNVALSPAPMAAALRDEVPEVADATRFGLWRTMPFQYEDKNFTAGKMLLADSNFFEFFSFKVIEGNPKTALNGPDKIAITQSEAKKYFGDESPLGKIILRGAESRATEVTALVEDPPHNSHISFDVILSGDSWGYMKNEQWSSNNIYTYFKIHPGADVSKVKVALDLFMEQRFGAEIERYIGVSFQQFKEQGNNAGYNILPMVDIYLHSNLQEEIKPNGNIQYLYIFGAIAIFIIIIACINFMNLSTARSANRAKEVGVRKSIGALRSRLIGQFLAESTIYSIISMLFALVIISLTLEPFNFLSGKQLTFGIFTNPLILGGLVLFTLLVGIIAGSYPAFYLTSFNPAIVLKGKVRSGVKSSGLRNGLVVFQFLISISLIISTMVVYKQLKFMQDKNLGFDKENVVNLLHTMSLGQNAKAFKDEVLSYVDFSAASFANNLPPNISWNSVFKRPDTDQDFLCNLNFADHDYIEAMGYEMVMGRYFSKDYPADTSAIVINETAFKQMGWTELSDQKLSGFWGNNEEPVEKTIIGVIKDFNFESLRYTVRPLLITLGTEPNYEMAIKMSPGNVADKIKILEGIWKKHTPSAAFEYTFVDSNFESMFQTEQKMSNIILIFTILAISIACLGLFGLATFTAEQRSKEISIRKAMGASVSNLVALLSKDFAKLVLIAFVISGPLSYYVMSNYWLQNFAYRVEIDVMMVLAAGLISIFIAWLTVSYQSFKTANTNPVEHLKSE